MDRPRSTGSRGKPEVRIAQWLEKRIGKDNQQTMYHLVEQLKSPLGIIPFVGAGMSKPFGFPAWKDFILGTAERRIKSKVKKLLKAEEFEEAAGLLKEQLGPDSFQNMMEAIFGSRNLEKANVREGALSHLPWLTSGPIVTTNFDPVLEHVFSAVGQTLKIVFGSQPDLIVKAIHRNQRVLLKIHGDAMDRESQVFTKLSYEENYGDAVAPDKRRTQLSSTAWLMFTNRPLLFLGSSLDKDRTVKVLSKIHQEFGALTHYAIVEAPSTPDEFDKRKMELRNIGISPLWFPPGQFAHIEDLLVELVERISTRPLSEEVGQKRAPKSVTTGKSERASKLLSLALRGSTNSKNDLPDGHYQLVRQEILTGRVAFFLGVWAHLGRLPLGREFYRELANRFECPDIIKERTAIAQYVADRHGRDRVSGHIHNILISKSPEPSLVHRFLAALPGILRAKGYNRASQFILTTNHDDVLEQSLRDAGEPFHLFSYQADGEDRGRFIHYSPDGRVRVIERPDNIKQLSGDHSIVVKLNGGIDRQGKIPESYVMTMGDFSDLAERIPAALPAVIRDRLRERSLLFVGHGLQEPDVEALVRYLKRKERAQRSWAIQKPSVNKEYWAEYGLDILEADLEAYIVELYNWIERYLPAK